MLPRVVEARVLPNRELELLFFSGETKRFDAKPYLDRGKYLELWDPAVFEQARVSLGAVEWPNGVDFDPEDLFRLSTLL